MGCGASKLGGDKASRPQTQRPPVAVGLPGEVRPLGAGRRRPPVRRLPQNWTQPHATRIKTHQDDIIHPVNKARLTGSISGGARGTVVRSLGAVSAWDQRQSSRPYQEDRVAVHCDEERREFAVAVFDGHGGEAVAEFLRVHALKEIMEELRACLETAKARSAQARSEATNRLRAPQPGPPRLRRSSTERTSKKVAQDAAKVAERRTTVLGSGQEFSSGTPGGFPTGEELCAALTRAFRRLDEYAAELTEGGALPGMCGACAVVAVLIGDALVVANAGDSEAVLSRAGRAVELCTLHKATNSAEIRRVRAAGGKVFVTGKVYRVNGQLAVTRSIGLATMKRQQPGVVIPDPYVRVIKLAAEDEFVVLGSDGLFDVFPHRRDLCSHVKEWMMAGGGQKHSLSSVAQRLVRLAVDTRSSGDNTSVVILAVNQFGVRTREAEAMGTGPGFAAATTSSVRAASISSRQRARSISQLPVGAIPVSRSRKESMGSASSTQRARKLSNTSSDNDVSEREDNNENNNDDPDQEEELDEDVLKHTSLHEVDDDDLEKLEAKEDENLSHTDVGAVELDGAMLDLEVTSAASSTGVAAPLGIRTDDVFIEREAPQVHEEQEDEEEDEDTAEEEEDFVEDAAQKTRDFVGDSTPKDDHEFLGDSTPKDDQDFVGDSTQNGDHDLKPTKKQSSPPQTNKSIPASSSSPPDKEQPKELLEYSSSSSEKDDDQKEEDEPTIATSNHLEQRSVVSDDPQIENHHKLHPLRPPSPTIVG